MTGYELLGLLISGYIICAMASPAPKQKISKPRKTNALGTPQYKRETPRTRRDVLPTIPKLSSTKLDAISGLRSLGYDKETAIAKVSKLSDSMTLESMIKQGLSQ